LAGVEEGEGLRLLRDRIEGGEGAGPGGVLGVVALAQVEEGAVENTAISDAAFFHKRPVAVFFAVFAAGVALEIHAGRVYQPRGENGNGAGLPQDVLEQEECGKWAISRESTPKLVRNLVQLRKIGQPCHFRERNHKPHTCVSWFQLLPG
jgi:hypothetical protein